MQVITLRFVAMRGIATALTFIFVHSDKDILFVPYWMQLVRWWLLSLCLLN